MKNKHPLLAGALLLSATGFVTRILGFLYKIFLSRLIGAEGLGIYQMIFPLFGICVSFTIAGVETSISRFTAGELQRGSETGARKILKTGLLLSVSLSLLTSAALCCNAEALAVHYLKEPRCGPLIRYMAFSLPLSACHSCISGYYYGRKKTGVPAFAQLLEQTARVGGVYLLASICAEKGIAPSPALAVLGLVLGEAVSALFCITAYSAQPVSGGPDHAKAPSVTVCLRRLLAMSVPLTGNRLVMNVLASLEAILIPLTLQAHGHDSSAAYSIYGTLTGMALSFILFPNVLTGSIATLLLPSVSEAQAAGNRARIQRTILKSLRLCLPFGAACTVFFLLTGEALGNLCFHSALAGSFIVTLAWICPFLYLNSTLNSILHGLGRTGTAFLNNLAGITVRILFVLLCVPAFGIQGYLWGLLANQLLVSVLCLFSLRRDFPVHVLPDKK